ncbi:reverse transcriptase domain-containing protein [Tanacetum coccineum]
MTPIYKYLTEEALLAEKEKARAKRRKSGRFDLPGEIISDNGKQLRDNPFKDRCEKLCICQLFASVKHPQANGLVERANRSLREGINARLDERSKDWIEEEVDINKKTENQAKMTKLSMEWKRLCKIKAKVQKYQSQSQY